MPELDKPRIILGLMTFAPDEITGARLTKLDDLKSALDIFHGRGYTELDTARAYGGGTQEGVSRQAGWKEKGFSIATKFWPLEPGFHKPEVITEMFETSLKELGTDFVDVSILLPCWRNPRLKEKRLTQRIRSRTCMPQYAMYPPPKNLRTTNPYRTAPSPSPRPSKPSTPSTKPANSAVLGSATTAPSKSPRLS